MSEDLKHIFLYRFLLAFLFFISALSFLLFPLNGMETYFFRIASGLTFLYQSLAAVFDIRRLANNG